MVAALRGGGGGGGGGGGEDVDVMLINNAFKPLNKFVPAS